MQVEIEHEEPATEEPNKLSTKFYSFSTTKSQELLKKYYNTVVQAQTHFINHYPLNTQYTFEVIQPPEMYS